MEYIIKKGFFKIAKQGKFNYDKEIEDIRKMFIKEREKVRLLLIKTYNRLKRFHWNIEPSTVEKSEVDCLQDIHYEVQMLVVMEAALTILIRKDIDNNEDLLEDRMHRGEEIHRVNIIKMLTYKWLRKVNAQTKSNHKLLDLLSIERLDHLEEDEIKEKFLEATLRGEKEANFKQNQRDKKMTLMEQRLRKKQIRLARQYRFKNNQRQLEVVKEKCIQEAENFDKTLN